MNSTDAVSETSDAGTGRKISSRVTSAMETLAPSVARHVGSGNFAAASGAVSLFRAVRSFRKGDRKRGLLRAAVGLFWVGVALAQRRRGKEPSGSELSRVADTGPDIEEAVEPGERETEHATGTGVVNTTDADIEESDTAPEAESPGESDLDATDADIDQRDVVGRSEAENAGESSEGDETGDAEPEAGTEGGEPEDEIGSEGGESETESAE